MSDYKVPIIPELNFKKNEQGNYIFKSDQINLMSNEDSRKCIAKNAEIIISDSIEISFEIDYLDYLLFFLDEVPSDGDGRTFIWGSEIKFFTISCNSNNYEINLLNFHSTNSTSGYKNGLKRNFVSGKCEKGIFIKDSNPIIETESVRIWDILECDKISQIGINEFDSKKLKGIYLKSINMVDYYDEYETNEDIKIHNTFRDNQNKSFNQLLNNNPFIFYESKYKDINLDIIKNIDKLLMFYNSNIIPSRMQIIESSDSNKLEIRINSKNTYKLNGNSIFNEDWPNNFFDFLNSSYDSYISAKYGEVDIDLLLHYYVWIKNEQYAEVKLMLCSAFLEVLKNNRFAESRKNQGGTFYKKLLNRLDFLNLDSIKFLKFFFSDIDKIISKIEVKFLKSEDKNDVEIICNDFRKYYIVYCLTLYRNKIIHSGKFNITSEDIDRGLMDKLINNLNKSFSKSSQKELVKKIGNDIKTEIKEVNDIFDIFKQTKFFENIVEIILLKYLNVDCILNKKHDFNSSSQFNINDYNSKKYMKLFIKE